jgi:DNA-binding NarL/FixJ family response regulator
MNLLIVDSDAIFREGLLSLLAKEPDSERLSQASTVSDALDSVVQLKPDVIFINRVLADGSGLDVLRFVVAHLPKACPIMVTDVASDEALFEALGAGAQGLIVKGTPFPTILLMLRAAQRGEVALSRGMMARLLAEFRRLKNSTKLPPSAIDTLTTRELEVLSRIGAGSSNREIAQDLVVSEHTVKVHVRHILAKLEMKNRAQAASLAKRHSLDKPNHTTPSKDGAGK